MHSRRLILSSMAAVALGAGLAACEAVEGRETAGQYVDDATITSRVKAALAADPVVKARQVSVETLRNEVQLSGFVATPEEASRAVQLTRGVQGVRGVKNSIVVR